ncbi:FAD-binding domain-containing protein [Exidia glandulosa HHB12029]|uniref:FAD-binding domain-containing protein n=1 Tax=Exidia glandulosa HHB12029 TaxID=1314781 RepID=A0A166BGW8_EXIGL|nr:FAD-binding domain-containing protein [Exidia glandulosa HHB12029]
MAMSLDILSVLSSDQVLTPSNGEAYEAALQRWSETSVRRAQLIVFPRTAEDVSKAVKYAVAHDIEIAIKGGGHSCSGASATTGIVIDLSNMDTVEVIPEKKLAKVGGGALWAAVDAAAAKHGFATVGGTVNHTGVGGLTVGGGFGFLSPKLGLAVDVLREAEVVLANGDVVVCNASEHPDLFWGIRGGGSNFGPVTSFTFELFPQENAVWSGLLIFTPDKLAEVFSALKEWYAAAGENEAANLFIGCGPPDFKPALVVLPFYNGSVEEAKVKFGCLLDVGPVADFTQEMAYPAVNTIQHPMTTHGDRKLFKATSFTSFSADLFQPIFDNYSELVETFPDTRGSAVIMEFYPPNKITSVPTGATAFPSRMARCNINFVPRWKDAALDSKMYEWASAQVDFVRNAEKLPAANRAYANYGFGDERARDVFGENYERMAKVKALYDPGNVFHKWYPVIPQA